MITLSTSFFAYGNNSRRMDRQAAASFEGQFFFVGCFNVSLIAVKLGVLGHMAQILVLKFDC